MVAQKTINLTAKPNDDHYPELIGSEYEVKSVHMGQSNTSIILANGNGVYNSVHLDFFIGDK